MNFQKASFEASPTQSAYAAPFAAQLCKSTRGKFWKTKRTFGSAAMRASIAGCAALHAGHCKSPNSTIVTAASLGPRDGPLIPFSSFFFAASNGLAPKGIISICPAKACSPSELTYIRMPCCPSVLARMTSTSAKPGTCDGLMLAIFQLIAESQPKVCFRKDSTVASEGRVLAVDEAEVADAGPAVCFAGTEVWA